MEWFLLAVGQVRYQEQLAVRAVGQQLLLAQLQQFPTQALQRLLLTPLATAQVVARLPLVLMEFHQVAALVFQLQLEL
jgi:hypothetical protein